MKNPFEIHGEKHKSRPMRQPKAREKELDENKQLFKQWKRWHEGRTKALLEGPHAEEAARLARFLESMTLEDGERLLDEIVAGAWLDTDDDTRFLVLSMISWNIIRLRERAGLAPFDDALPGEEDTVFQIVRRMLA